MKNHLRGLLSAVGNAMFPGPSLVDIPPEWLAPIHPESPSGPYLEYDPEYSVLAARLAPKADVQYGEFKASAAEPDWKEVERDCRRLLLRSKDISVLIWLARSRTRQAGALGLLQGLGALQQMCLNFAPSIHPQTVIDGESEPLVRANALAALCDPEGLLEDVREVVIVSASAHRLTVRDVERALAVPRSAYAMDPEALRRQLNDLLQRSDPQLQALQACAACVQDLQQWATEQLGDDAPHLTALARLLHPLRGSPLAPTTPADKVTAEAIEPSPHTAPHLAPPNHAPTHPFGAQATELMPALTQTTTAGQSREQVRQALVQVRRWIEENEPSSPVSVLLKQAERMWGKRFSEVAHLIPPDLLQAWDKDE